jgi:hypothetical protein
VIGCVDTRRGGIKVKNAVAILIAVAVCATGAAHEALSLEELMAARGVDIDAIEVRAETVADGLHVLYGAGGNVAVSIGDHGVLMVDSQFPQMIPKLRAAIQELGGGDVDFTVNTHWHFDHADGNPMLGREGTWMVSQSNSRRTIDQGMSLEEVVAAKPTARFDETYGDPGSFINRAYESLAR